MNHTKACRLCKARPPIAGRRFCRPCINANFEGGAKPLKKKKVKSVKVRNHSGLYYPYGQEGVKVSRRKVKRPLPGEICLVNRPYIWGEPLLPSGIKASKISS